MITFTQSPLAQLPYTVDWSKWLEVGEVLASATWSVPSGIVNEASTFDDTTATIWIGTPAPTTGTYQVKCTVLSDASPTKTDSRTFVIKVLQL